MPSITVRNNESFDMALRRFKRTCEKSGVISEMRRHEYYEKPKWKRKRLAAQAVKRLMKRLARDRGALSRRKRGEKTDKGGKK